MASKLVVPTALVIALAGCGSIGAVGLQTYERPSPPQATGLPPVQSADLPPLSGDGQVATVPPDGTIEPLTPPASGPVATTAPPPLGRTDLLGGWTITSGGDSCQLFMTLTSWTGGYRASTRGCNDGTLKSISAWNLEGGQVVLAGQGGSTLARLQSSGGNRFDGQTVSGGAAVTFYR
jgi:hypothetical protein